MAKGFLESVFDFDFTDLVTIRIVKVVFGISIIGAGIWALVTLWSATQLSGFGSLIAVAVAIFGFFIFVIMARIYLEVVVVLFRINDNTRTTNKHLVTLVETLSQASLQATEREVQEKLAQTTQKPSGPAGSEGGKSEDTVVKDVSQLSLGKDAEDVYRYLANHGRAGFDDIAQQTGMTAQEVSQGISALQGHDLVERHRGGEYTAK